MVIWLFLPMDDMGHVDPYHTPLDHFGLICLLDVGPDTRMKL